MKKVEDNAKVTQETEAVKTDTKEPNEGSQQKEEKKNLTEEEILATYQTAAELVNVFDTQPQIPEPPKRHYGAYQNKKEKAADVKSSAITLFIVGGAGMAADILCVFDKLPFHFNIYGKVITCGAMGILFLCMIIFGFVSLKSFKGLSRQASEEDKLTSEIEKWYRNELTQDKIEADLFDENESDFPDEIKYFKRANKIMALLNEKFMNLDRSYAENIAEKIYQYIYEEKHES